jgi:hypothetical protein
MNRKAFDVALDTVVVEAVLPRATLEEMEELIAIPVKKQLRRIFDCRSDTVIKQIGDLGINFAAGLTLVVIVLVFILGLRLR